MSIPLLASRFADALEPHAKPGASATSIVVITTSVCVFTSTTLKTIAYPVPTVERTEQLDKIAPGQASRSEVNPMVPGGGLEPPRPCGLRILSPLRLPISPSGPDDGCLFHGKSKRGPADALRKLCSQSEHVSIRPRWAVLFWNALLQHPIGDAESECFRHLIDIPRSRCPRRRSSSPSRKAGAS